MKTKLYREFASRVVAIHNCNVAAQRETTAEMYNYRIGWRERHSEVVLKLMELLPHGSGLNDRWYIDVPRSNQNRLIFSSSFHAMDERHGGYDWIDFRVVVTASLLSEIDLIIVGNFGRYQDIKEYLYQILTPAFLENLTVEVQEDDLPEGCNPEDRLVTFRLDNGLFVIA